MLASEASQENFAFFNHQIWKYSEIRTLFLFLRILGGGGKRPFHPPLNPPLHAQELHPSCSLGE